jgi:DNA-binding NarL/FixJ family response regulator
MSEIKVLLVDDQALIRDGLRAVLLAYPEISVIADVENGKLALEAVERYNPDIVLMDIRMPVMDGVEATRLIKESYPKTVIIILTTFDDDEYIIKALTFGASGYLLKDINGEGLVRAIRDGYLGNIVLPGRIASKITSHLSKEMVPKGDLSDFTSREQEIIRMLVRGASNKEIAETLYLSMGTVKNYISQIYSKAEIADRANAVIHFKKMGF